MPDIPTALQVKRHTRALVHTQRCSHAVAHSSSLPKTQKGQRLATPLSPAVLVGSRAEIQDMKSGAECNQRVCTQVEVGVGGRWLAATYAWPPTESA